MNDKDFQRILDVTDSLIEIKQQAATYRAIARILGIDAADREAVERRVKVLMLRPESKSQMRRFEAQIGD